MIVFDGLELIGLVITVVFLVICGFAFVINRIVNAVKKRQQRRIDDAYTEKEAAEAWNRRADGGTDT